MHVFRYEMNILSSPAQMAQLIRCFDFPPKGEKYFWQGEQI